MGVEALLVKIDRVRDRERTVSVTAGLLKFVLAVIGLVAGFFLLDWLILGRLVEGAAANRLARGVLLVAMVGTLVYVFLRCVWQELARELDDDEIALRVEGRHPDLRGRLISTIQLTRELQEGEDYIGSEELIRALETDTVSFAGALNFADIISLETLKKVAVAALSFTLLSAAMGAWRIDYAKILLGRMLLADADYPTATRIFFVTPGCIVGLGEPHDVEVELDPGGYLPETAHLVVKPVAGGDEYRCEMSAPEGEEADTREGEDATGAGGEGGASAESGSASLGPHGGVVYRGTIVRVMEDLEYRVLAHDARSTGWEKLRMLRRPAVRSLELTYRFPAYTGKPGRTTSVGDIRATEGTVVEIVVSLTKPVASAKQSTRLGMVDAPAPVPMRLDEDRAVATTTMRVESDGYYWIELVDDKGLGNKDPIEYVIDAVKDKSPSVRITFPARDKTATRFARWPIRFEARDDYGITRGWLRYRVSSADVPLEDEGFLRDAEEAAEADREGAPGFELVGLTASAGQREVKAETPFDLQILDVRPGQRVTYWIEIADNRSSEKGDPQPNIGYSRRFEFLIAEADEVMFMIGTMQDEALGRIDTIIEKQEETKESVDEIRQRARRGEYGR